MHNMVRIPPSSLLGFWVKHAYRPGEWYLDFLPHSFQSIQVCTFGSKSLNIFPLKWNKQVM